jgi:Mg2+ and Co2+ transporter CorA
MHAYDALFTMTQSIQSSECRSIDTDVQAILKDFNHRGSLLPIKEQERMRTLKNSVTQMESWMGNLAAALEAVIEDDEEMALMNLTRLADCPSLYSYPLSDDIKGHHEEVEELLESYVMDYSSLQAKLEYLHTLMQNAEEFVSLRLDFARNELMAANTMLTLLSVCIGFSAYITGVFGMNLDQTTGGGWPSSSAPLQSTPNVFIIVFCVTFALIFVVFSLVVLFLQHTKVLPTRQRLPKVGVHIAGRRRKQD